MSLRILIIIYNLEHNFKKYFNIKSIYYKDWFIYHQVNAMYFHYTLNSCECAFLNPYLKC